MSTRSTGRPAQSAAAPAERPRSRNICTFVLGVERCCWLDDLAVCTSSAMHHGGLGAVAAYQYSQERIRTTSCAQIGPRIFGGTRYPQHSRSGATAPHGHKPEGASISHGQSLTRCLARSSVRTPRVDVRFHPASSQDSSLQSGGLSASLATRPNPRYGMGARSVRHSFPR